MNKKILIVTDHEWKRLDVGADFRRHFLNECVQRNFHVEFILPREPFDIVKKELKNVQFTYRVFKNWWNKQNIDKRNNIRIVIPLLKIIQKEKFDLIAFHFCSAWTVLLVALFSKLLLCKPTLIWHQHSEVRTSSSLYLMRKIKNNFSKIRFLSFFIEHICPVSEAVKNQLLLKKVSARKITVLYNGINPKKYEYQGNINEIFKDLQLSDNMSVVTTVSTLIPAKGLEYLLRAIEIVKRNNFSVKFIIVGEGPFLQELKQLASDLNITDNVYFTGRRNDVPQILCTSDFVVQPTLKEAFSNFVLESMAAKKAVIATSVGGIPELVQNGINGIIVPPNDYVAISDAILKLLGNTELSKKMGLCGRMMVEEEFTLEKMVKNYFLVYEKHLNRTDI